MTEKAKLAVVFIDGPDSGSVRFYEWGDWSPKTLPPGYSLKSCVGFSEFDVMSCICSNVSEKRGATQKEIDEVRGLLMDRLAAKEKKS